MKAFVLSLEWLPTDYGDLSVVKPIKVFLSKPSKVQIVKAIRQHLPPNTPWIYLMVDRSVSVEVDCGDWVEHVRWELSEVECEL